MARVRGVYLRTAPKGPSSYTSKEAALVANPTMLVADAAFPKDRQESVKNAAFRVNSGGRGEWSNSEYFAVWEYAKDIVLRVKPGDSDAAVEVIGFAQGEEAQGGDGKKATVSTVIGEDGNPAGKLEDILREEGVETGGWVMLIGLQPNVPEGWEKTVNAPGSRKRKRRDSAGE